MENANVRLMADPGSKCDQCGTVIIRWGQRRFCDQYCRNAWHNERRRRALELVMKLELLEAAE
jgi:hypothetical protein